MEKIDNSTLFEIIKQKKIMTRDGVEKRLHSHIDKEEGMFLQKIIVDDPGIVRSLEVGCAYGIASMFICNALKGRRGAIHTIVDPRQTTDWREGGILNLKKNEVDFFELIEDESQLVLPHLLREGREYDFVFIDGYHTFDATLIDLYYAIRLLRKGGVVVVDDCYMPSVAKALKYVGKWPCLKMIDTLGEGRSMKRKFAHKISKIFPEIIAENILPIRLVDRVYAKGTMVALKKIGNDTRQWNWYVNF